MEIRKARIKYEDGTYSESYPIGCDADYINMESGNNLNKEINIIENEIQEMKNRDSAQNKILYDNKEKIANNQGRIDAQELINDNQDREILQIKKNIKNGNIYVFNTVADMKKAALSEGMCVKTLGYYNVNDGGDAYYTIRTKKTSDIEDNGSIHFVSTNLVAEMIIENDINYNQFGAYGDGIHNDYFYLYNAHIFANKYKYNISTNNNSTYLIKDINNSIPIETNVNWKKSKFIIDDSNIDINNDENKKFIFKIKSKNAYKDVTNLLIGKKVIKGQEYIQELAGNSNCYLRISNSNKKIYIRKGANENQGINLFDITRIDNQGKIIDEIIWDFDTITKAEIRKIDESELKISGGIFTTIVNKIDSYNYYNRGIEISRDNVILENLEHYLEGEDVLTSSPYNGFIIVNHTVNVMLKNCILTAHKYWKTSSNVAKGSYDFGTTEDINIKIINCKQSNSITTEDFWSVFSGYNSKNLFLENIEFNRFGSHMGFWNFTIKNSIIGCRAMGFCGGGIGNFENVKVLNSKEFIEMKDDYGSFFDGTFNIRNCSISYETKENITEYNVPVIIKAINNGQYNYGIIPYLPKLYIENFNFLYGGKGIQFCSVLEVSKPIEGVDYSKTYLENALNGYFPQIFFPEIICKDIHINNKEKQRFVLSQTQDLWKVYCSTRGIALNYCDDNYPWGMDTYYNWKDNIKCNCKIILDNCDFVNFYNDFNKYRCSLYGTGDSNMGEINNTYNFVPNITIRNINEFLLFGLGHRSGLFNIENCNIQTLTTASENNKTYSYFNIKNCNFIYKYYSDTYPSDPNVANFRPYWNQIKLDNVIFKKYNQSTELLDLINEFPFSTMIINTTSNNFLRISGEIINCKAWDSFKEEADSVQMMSTLNRKIYGFKLEDIFNHTNKISFPRKFGTTSQRPSETDLYILNPGYIYYDTTINKSILWNGTKWKNLDGTDL